MTIEKQGSHEWAYTRLDQYLKDGLEGDEASAIGAHLGECQTCQQRVVKLRGVEPDHARGLAAPEPAPREQARGRQRAERGASAFDLVRAADIEALSAFQSDSAPVISLYLDMSPSERQGDKIRAKLKSLMDETSRSLNDASEAQRRGYEREAERILNWFNTQYDDGGRGLALFACGEQELWRVFQLPAPARDQMVVADRPYVLPLLTLMDEYERFLLVLIDKQAARLFVASMGALVEYSEVADEIVPHPKAGGQQAEKHQRHHDMHVLWHVKHAVEVAERLFARERCNWLIIGGPQETLAELRSNLPKALSERLAAEISVPLRARPDEILPHVLEAEQAVERRIESERVDALLTAALGQGAGVLGLERTLNALVEGRVLTLIVNDGFQHMGYECSNCRNLVARKTRRCPLCDAPLDAAVDIIARALERAIEQEASIEVLRGEEQRAALEEHGQIGALLRYNVNASKQGQP